MVAAPRSELEHAYQAPSMSFALSSASDTSSARTGTLVFTPTTAVTDEITRTPRTVETPTLIAYTRRGAMPHLTRDNIARLPNEMVHLSLEHLMDMPVPAFSRAPFALHRFIGLQETERQRAQIVTMSLRDASDKTEMPPALESGLTANTLRGAVKVTPQDYLDAVLDRPPDILFAFGDDNLIRPRAKRVEKSIRRSLNWTKEVAVGAQRRTNVFAPLIGDDNALAREQYAQALMGQTPALATARGSLQDGGPPIDELISGYALLAPVEPESKDTTGKLFNASLRLLPSHKPRVAQRVAGPHDILRLVRDVGLDLFIDEWSSRCASIGVGLDFDFPAPRSTAPASAPRQSASGKRDIGHSYFDMEFAEAFSPLSDSSLAQLPPSQPHPFGPQPPTRGYVHHLLHAHEMTSHVILALHNNIVMHNFFGRIRDVIAKGNGAFEDEVARFFEFYEDCADGEGHYPCLLAAKLEWVKVDKERGKGSSKDKRALDAAKSAVKAAEDTERMALRENDVQQPLVAE